MTPSLPAWVQKRDGRREAFDADKISQSIFAATETIGEPNAFLARELADGVLHFLVQENETETISAAQIAELVEKIVRELGQPALGQTYAQRLGMLERDQEREKSGHQQVPFTFSPNDHPNDVKFDCLEAYSLHAIFGRDIAAAHRAGLLKLCGLTAPCHFKSIVVDPPREEPTVSPWTLGWSQVHEASRRAGDLLIIDSPELSFNAHGHPWLEGLVSAITAYQRSILFNLRVATPPAWASNAVVGPLFSNMEVGQPLTQAGVTAILDAAASNRTPSFRIRWHVQANDFTEPSVRQVYEVLFARPTLWPRVTFAFDRARRTIGLAMGVDRGRPATLLHVCLHMPNFLQLPEIGGELHRLMTKLPSLMRMAVSAGAQKRDYLRRHCSELSREFLLDRARLIVEPTFLDECVQALVGATPHQSKLALNAACEILQTLRDAADRESQASSLDVCLVHDCQIDLRGPQANLITQLQPAGGLMQTVHDGILRIWTPPLSAEEFLQYLHAAWRVPNVQSVRFLSAALGDPEAAPAAQASTF